jgi:hypothetical protein
MIQHYSTTRRTPVGATARRLLTLLASACALAVPASAVAATNVSRDVEKFTVSPDTMCGFTGASSWIFDLTSGPIANGNSFVAGPIVQTFTADNGRGVKITYDDGVVKIDPAVYYPDGSSSITVVEAGLNVKTQAVGGPLLEQSTGRLTYTYYFDASGDFVSLTIDSASGPENNVTGAPDCSVVGPYLAGS